MPTFSIDVDIADFDRDVVQASRRVPVLVDFWAEWCAPCRTLKPILEKLATQYGGRFMLAKVDSDRNQELTARYGVRGIPCVKAFVAGEMVDEFTGALPEAQVRAFIERLMPSPAEPLRVAAAEARAQGDTEVARSLLEDAMQLDPANPDVQFDLAEVRIDLRDLDAARSILDAHGELSHPRAAALQARLNLAGAAGAADLSGLEARIEADAGDLDARFQLAQAMALANDYRVAFEQLLEIVRLNQSGTTKPRAGPCSIYSRCSAPLPGTKIWCAIFASGWHEP